MTKVKITECTITTKLIDLEYPIYLYFQDESCFDELIRVDEKIQTRIKWSPIGLIIEQGQLMNVEEHHLKDLTTKNHFDEMYKYALEQINSYL